MKVLTAKDITSYMESLQDKEQQKILMRFFKTGEGEYGYGDQFLGLKVPQTREVVKHVATGIELSEVPELLMSRWHEVRLCGFLIMADKFNKLSTKKLTENNDAITKRDDIIRMYLRYADQANNWDLVDLPAPYIIGQWLMLPSHIGNKQQVVDDLAFSDNLWRQRISMVCTWMTSKMKDPSWCLRYAEIHLHHPHDLMHKAVGWMLREMGKRVSIDILRDFLRQHVHEMHRTTLRYAIEKMSVEERKYWMNI